MCLHEETIESYPDCEIVCLQCGVVLEKILDRSPENLPFIVDEFDVLLMREALTDIVNNIHLPMNCIEPVIAKYKQVRIETNLTKFKNRELLCFVLYNFLIEEGVPRLLHDICRQCHVRASRIWDIQKESNAFADLEPQLLVCRVIDILKIPYHHLDSIKSTITFLDNISCAKPETIAACAIYATVECELSDVCEHCQISKSSVTSLYKRYMRHKNE